MTHTVTITATIQAPSAQAALDKIQHHIPPGLATHLQVSVTDTPPPPPTDTERVEALRAAGRDLQAGRITQAQFLAAATVHLAE